MCIGSNSVNQAQDLMTVTKIEDLPNSLLPSMKGCIKLDRGSKKVLLPLATSMKIIMRVEYKNTNYICFIYSECAVCDSQ